MKNILISLFNILSLWLDLQKQLASSYSVYTVDDPNVCNKTIYLEQGDKSAAILKLTSTEIYSTASLYCTISFKVPIHSWSGLTGILEHVDLRKYQDTGHHLGESFCVDYISVLTENSNSLPNEKQCGTRSITPGQPLSRFGYNKALIGHCPHINTHDKMEKCNEVTELKVVVSIGKEKRYLWQNLTWAPHTGFTFVVTAYSYPIKNGESECRDGLFPCSHPNTIDGHLGVFHCVHNSLWCDGHINCALIQNMDEMTCFKRGTWNQIMTLLAPWTGTLMFLILGFCAFYRRFLRVTRYHEDEIEAAGDFNSYAESYEMGASSSRAAHQMAIQVRVVCNSGSGGHRQRHQNLRNDLPPSYDSLFPHGPPSTYTSSTSTSTEVTNIITTVTSNITFPPAYIGTGDNEQRSNALNPSQTAEVNRVSSLPPENDQVISVHRTSPKVENRTNQSSIRSVDTSSLQQSNVDFNSGDCGISGSPSTSQSSPNECRSVTTSARILHRVTT